MARRKRSKPQKDKPESQIQSTIAKENSARKKYNFLVLGSIFGYLLEVTVFFCLVQLTETRVDDAGIDSDFGFWAPVTANTSFCETRYWLSEYICEFWNSLSAIFFIIAGCVLVHRVSEMGLTNWHKMHLNFLGICFVFTGAATLVFHLTLKKIPQKLDQLSMSCICLAFALNTICQFQKRSKRTYFKFFLGCLYVSSILISAASFLTTFLYPSMVNLFRAGYIVWSGLVFILGSLSLWDALLTKKFIVWGLYCTNVGFGAWVLERTICRYVKILQLHAVWHISMALMLWFFSQAFLTAYLGEERSGLHKKFGFLPYVIEKCTKLV